MYLKELTIQHCRCIEHCHIDLSPQINVLVGDNASGKSSFLEALSLLSRGRSFRTPRIREVIQHGSNEVLVSGKVQVQQPESCYPVGIAKTATSSKIRINHEDIQQQAKLSRHVPLSLIHPEALNIITGAPSLRRALLDWITFYCETEFHSVWKTYQRILKQRNACLRDEQQQYALTYWTEQLVQYQPQIMQFRQQSLNALKQGLLHYHDLLKSLGNLEIKLSTGFPQHVDNFDQEKMLSFLNMKKKNEINHGVSLYGAHRADMHLFLDDLPVDKVASRGQLKLLGMALTLAQNQAVTDQVQQKGIIAVDDLASELDNNAQDVLFQALQQTEQQLIITGTSVPPMDINKQEAEMFHVKHGCISAWQ